MSVGKDGRLLIGGATAVLIDQWELDLTQDALEVTAFDNKDRKYELGLRNAAGTFQGTYVSTGAGQSAVLANFESTNTAAKTTAVMIYNNVTGSIAGWSGTAIITGVRIGNPVSGRTDISGSIQFDGGVSAYTS